MERPIRIAHTEAARAVHLIALGLLALLCGCSYAANTRLDYTPAGPLATTAAPFTLAVVPFEEGRPPRYYPSQLGRMFLTYVPLIPYVEIPYERLDESFLLGTRAGGPFSWGDQHFTVAMARVVADDLRHSGSFREVRDASDPTAVTDADMILGGRLVSTEFDVYATSYMLGAPGVLLWVAPIPSGANAATVEIELWLRDRNGATLWSHTLKGRSRKLFTAYAPGASITNLASLEIEQFGPNDRGVDGNSLWAYHADALRSGMEEAKASLNNYLSQHHRTD